MKNILCSSSLFTNSNWFAFDEDKALNDVSVSSEASPSPNSEVSSPEVDDDMDEIVLGGVSDSTKDSETLLPVCNKDSDEQSGQTVLTNGPVDKLEDDIRPPTPDVKESQSECVEWREEGAEPADIVEKDIVPNFEAGSENQVDATNDVKPDDAKVGEGKKSDSSVGSSIPVSMTEAVLVSPAVNSIKHTDPADDSTVFDSLVNEQNHEKDEIQGK
jgi:serine/threonine-protein phosphatase 6 regulatory subunit 3